MSTRYIAISDPEKHPVGHVVNAYLYNGFEIARTYAHGFIVTLSDEDENRLDYRINYQAGRLNSGWGMVATVHDTERDALDALADRFFPSDLGA